MVASRLRLCFCFCLQDAGMVTPQHTPEGRGFDSSLIYFE